MELTGNFMALSLHPGPMLVFGLFLLFGVLGGIIANRISWLPTISSFMFLGFLVGPHCFSLVTQSMLHDSAVLTTIAMGLILYKLGNALHPKEMMHSRTLHYMALGENVLSFILSFAVILACGFGTLQAWIVAAIAISSSPAVLVHVAAEMRAGGPVTDRAKSLIAVNNLLSFTLFSLGLPFAMSGGGTALKAIGYTAYMFAGAVATGIAVAWLSVRLARMMKLHDEHYRFSIVIGAIMLVLGLCNMFSFSSLFASLVLGIATRWFETSKHNLSRVAIGEGGDLFFISLFVFAGAKIDPVMVVATGIAPLVLVFARAGGKSIGIYLATFFTKAVKENVVAISLLLMPMASMAIGLALTVSRLLPDMATGVMTVIISMIAILEMVGPIAAKEAFLMCGEAGQEKEDD
jgi:Kef-type K+ transport system membrane component KefB